MRPNGRQPAQQRTQVFLYDGPDVGVDDRRAGALVFADLGQDVARQRNRYVRVELGQNLTHSSFMDRVGIRVEQTDGDGFDTYPVSS